MTDTNERPGLSRAEPPPIPNDSPAIADLVIADMLDRKAAGIAKYGVALQANNGRNALVDLYQELLDAVVYTRQEIEERKGVETMRRLDGRTAYDRARTSNGWDATWDELSDEDHAQWDRMAASPVSRADYVALEGQLAEARLAANRANDGHWIWQGDGSDDLDSMGSTMPVSITAGQLRGLLERETVEWRSMALRYQARHATLRGIQRAVTDVVTSIEERNDPTLDVIADRLVAALGNPTPIDDLGRSPQEQQAWDVLMRVAGNVERQLPKPLPDVSTLRQWMVEKTPIFLTFESGPRADLPSSGAVQRGIIANIGRSGIAVEHDGTMHAFDFVKPSEARKVQHVSWLISIGARRDTVLLPIESAWTDASDPIVETWVGREIECTSAHTESWTCVLVAIEGTVLRTDYSDHGDVVCDRVPRKHLQVRLVSEVVK
jgi:hypothetical protein